MKLFVYKTLFVALTVFILFHLTFGYVLKSYEKKLYNNFSSQKLKEIKEKGLTEKLVGIELEGDPIIKVPENFWSVKKNDKKVGRVSRAFFSPRLQKNIALAIVDIEYAEEETHVVVESPNGDLKSKVVSLPWFKADKETHLD